jgi:peptide/nickel transport system permease protein
MRVGNVSVENATGAMPPSPPDPPGLAAGPSRVPMVPRTLTGFVTRRLLAGLATLFVASVLTFAATNALPGNAVAVVLGKHATPSLVATVGRQLHLTGPLIPRYLQWVGDILHGNLGLSSAALVQGYQRPVSGLIGGPLLNSFILASITMLLLVPSSLLLGTVAAVRANRAADYAASYSELALGALPEFVLGTFLILIFFSELHLLPPVALVPPGASPLADPEALVLPILTLLGVAVAFCARQVRAGVITALRQDYVTTARLNGVPEHRVLWRYALRNALAPSVQSFAQALQYLFGGIIVVESLFAYPGIGSLLVQAVLNRDLTEVQSIAIVLAALYIAVNVAADLIVVLLVPKLRASYH